MFRIEKKGPHDHEQRVVDDDRDVWLQFVSGLGPEPGVAFKLVWGDRVIPFEVLSEHQIDPITGEEFYRTRFLTFGTSSTVEFRAGIKGYRFSSERERWRAQMLAVEALLIFGSSYNGDRRPEGYNRVSFLGCTYTKQDFEPPVWRAFLGRARKRLVAFSRLARWP